MFKKHYSGKESKQFWEKLESDTGEDLYALGCKLKNLESHLLNILNKKN